MTEQAMYVVERRGISHGSIVGIFPTYQEAYDAGLDRVMDWDPNPYAQSDGDGWHTFHISKWAFGKAGYDPVGEFEAHKNHRNGSIPPKVFFKDAHGDKREVMRK